jgi:hypothetical protein
VAVFKVTHLRTIRRDQQFGTSGVESTAFGFPFDQFDQHRVSDRRQPQPRPFRQPRFNQPRIGHAISAIIHAARSGRVAVVADGFAVARPATAVAAVVVSVVVGVGPASHAATVHEREFALQHMFEYSLHASRPALSVSTHPASMPEGGPMATERTGSTDAVRWEPPVVKPEPRPSQASRATRVDCRACGGPGSHRDLTRRSRRPQARPVRYAP